MTRHDDTGTVNGEANPSAWIALPLPPWEVWGSRNRCKLWQAVCLGCNVDPACFEPYGLTASEASDSVLTPVTPSIQNLLGLSKIAVASGALRTIRIESANLMDSEVDLSVFTGWALSSRHRLPENYPWEPQTLVDGQYQWPWGTYQTPSLQLLARAVDRFWKNYDPQDPSTAPTNAMVSNWLEEKGMPKRTAEVVATMLRATDLPMGRR